MPRLKITKADEHKRVFKSIIEGNMIRYGVTKKDIAKVMGVTTRTVNRKIAEPSLCSMDDLQVFIKLLKMDGGQIIELMGGER